MKQILIIITLFIGINTYANDTTQYVTNSNVEKLVDKYSEKLSATITSLAQSLKQPAEHVYKILVKQQVVKSFGYSLFLLLAITFILLFCYNIKRAKWLEDDTYNRRDYPGETWNSNATLTIITGILALIFIGLSAGFFYPMLQGFLNPEYGAIKDIVEMIK